MSFAKISEHSIAALSALSLLFVVSCEKDNSKKDNPKKTETVADSSEEKSKINKKHSIYAEAIADYEWDEIEVDGEKMWSFSISFIPKESEGKRADGKRVKDHPIRSFYSILLSVIEQRVKKYKPGIKPLKHQKIKVKYEKDEPIMFSRLESFKCQDEQGNIVELDF